MRDAALRVDDHGRAGVGGAQHGPGEFKRTHARDVQMLVNRHRVAEPSDIADVDQHRRRVGSVFEVGTQFFTKQVLVANVWRESLAAPFKRCLRQAAAVEVAQRNLHHADEPVEKRRHKLAKGHKVMFVVAVVRRAGLQAQHRVAVTITVGAQRKAYQCGLLAAGEAGFHRIPDVAGDLLGQHGKRGLRQNHQGSLHLFQLLAIKLQRICHAGARLKLQILRDIALQQGD